VPKNHPVILLTRPKAQAERFAQALGDATIVISPLIRIEYLPLTLELDAYSGLIFTSENGVRACGRSDLPAYCVGDRTTEVAEAAGMQAVSAGGSADDLVTMIAQHRVDGKLLHIHGEHITGSVAERLRKNGHQLDDVVGYRQIAVPLNPDARRLLAGEKKVILPLFSPRSARLFFQNAGQIKAPLRVVVISKVVGEAVSGEFTIAKTPDMQAMVRLIKKHIDA